MFFTERVRLMGMKKAIVLLVLTVFAVSCGGPAQRSAKWVNLFDGKTLDGWVQRGGVAKYQVKNGTIVGTTVLNTPNSFLCTKKNYSDFILEVEFKVDEKLNSGIQIRSNVYDEDTTVWMGTGENRKKKVHTAGRVHGYQVEIDPSQSKSGSANFTAAGKPVPPGTPRSWTGGIYDEGRRGWLNNLAHNEAARNAFKPGEWNHFRIEAIGDSIKTWVNGVPAADLKDDMTPSGLIALQVHGTKEKDPHSVMWRNIRIQDLSR